MSDGVKISGLPSADALAGDELVEVVQGGESRQCTTRDLQNILGPSSLGGYVERWNWQDYNLTNGNTSANWTDFPSGMSMANGILESAWRDDGARIWTVPENFGLNRNIECTISMRARKKYSHDNDVHCRLLHNNSEVLRRTRTSGGVGTHSGNITLAVSAGDTLQFQFFIGNDDVDTGLQVQASSSTYMRLEVL